jgi:GTP-binding protein HflX
VLLHVRDAASGYGEEQKVQVEKVLGELEAVQKPRIEVLNKIDLLGEDERRGLIEGAAPAVPVSARTGEGIDALLQAIDQALHSDPLIEAEFRIPQHEGAALAAVEAGMIVHDRRYEDNLVLMSVTGPASLIGRLRQYKLQG